jgi:hypothetical protein
MTSGCAPDGRGTWSCTLSRAGGYQALVLWNSSKTVSYPVPEQYIDARDLMGNVRSLPGGNLQVGDSPVLVETGLAF